jgi:hypothetical protein
LHKSNSRDFHLIDEDGFRVVKPVYWWRKSDLHSRKDQHFTNQKNWSRGKGNTGLWSLGNASIVSPLSTWLLTAGTTLNAGNA